MSTQSQDAAPQLLTFTPPADVRRGSGRLLLIFAIVVAAARFLLWRTPAKASGYTAYFLILLSAYLLSVFAQLVFGVSINEQYQTFWQATGKQKLRYLAIIVIIIGLIVPFVGVVFPGLWSRM